MKSLSISLVLLLSMFLVSSCGGKQKKNDEATDAASDQAADSSVSQKDLSFSAAGSDSGQIAGLNTIFFEYDSSTLTAEAKQKLADNAKWIKTQKKVKVQVEGHCDQRGSTEYNLALGERRAKAVRNYLINMGVDGKQLSTISYGKEKPLVNGDDEAASSKNRRANFLPIQ